MEKTLPFDYFHYYENTTEEAFLNALIQKKFVYLNLFDFCGGQIYRVSTERIIYFKNGFKSKLGSTGPCFMYIWGFPGPDYDIFSFEDYGKTWAFTKEELIKKESK